MRDRKLVGSRQRSLSCRFSLPCRERPLLAGKKNESDDTQNVIVRVVSSLEYIRKQQVASINKLHGFSAAAVGDNEETDKDIEELKMEVRTSYFAVQNSGSAINGSIVSRGDWLGKRNMSFFANFNVT